MNERIQELLIEAHKQTYGGIYNGHLSMWTEKFANLIAAAEREACAKVCEETTASWTEHTYNSACIDCAAAIRARGEKLSSQDNLTKSPINRRYTCHVCNRQEMVRAKFDEESG